MVINTFGGSFAFLGDYFPLSTGTHLFPVAFGGRDANLGMVNSMSAAELVL